MNKDFVDSEVHFLRAENFASKFELLGVSILAYLSAIPGLFENDIGGIRRTIKEYSDLFNRPEKDRFGYIKAWEGKAFEYAVAELFNNRSEPHYSLIFQGIEKALATIVSSKVSNKGLDIEQSSCIRVAKESPDAEYLRGAFGRFRILRDARRSIDNATKTFRGLEDKVDVLFCERGAEAASQFAILASLKLKRQRFSRSNFDKFPIDLGITIGTAEYGEVRFDEKLGVHVIYLPLRADLSVIAWEEASRIVEAALSQGGRPLFLRFVRRYLEKSLRIPEVSHWVDFLADRLQADIRDVAEEIRQLIHPPRERIVTVPVLLGAKRDVVLDLITP